MVKAPDGADVDSIILLDNLDWLKLCRGPPFRAHFASPFLGLLYKSFYARSTCGGAAAEIQLLWVSSATHIHHTMTPRTYCCKTGNKTISEPQLDSWEVHV